jgi:hypothetical protein
VLEQMYTTNELDNNYSSKQREVLGCLAALIRICRSSESLDLGEGDSGVDFGGEELGPELANIETKLLAVNEGARYEVGGDGVIDCDGCDVNLSVGGADIWQPGKVVFCNAVGDSIADGVEGVEEAGEALCSGGELLDEEIVLAGYVLVAQLDQ